MKSICSTIYLLLSLSVISCTSHTQNDFPVPDSPQIIAVSGAGSKIYLTDNKGQSSFQIPNVSAGTGASNVIPGEFNVQFNLRFSTELSNDIIVERITTTLDKYDFEYDLKWTFNGDPFLTDAGSLLDAIVDAVGHVNDVKPALLTTGGTSDGRFIARMGGQVVELGPVNATIHKVNECVKVADLEKLTDMYERTLVNLFAK